MNDGEPKPDRRELFRSAGRAAATGALAALAVVLPRRGAAASCDRRTCRRCPVLTRCELPRASDERRRARKP